MFLIICSFALYRRSSTFILSSPVDAWSCCVENVLPLGFTAMISGSTIPIDVFCLLSYCCS